MKLTSHFSVEPRLRLSGGIPLLTSYVVESETVLSFLQCIGGVRSSKSHFIKGEQGARGCVVVKALRYKPAGRGFDSRWCHWN